MIISLYTSFQNWRMRLKARRLYIELTDRLNNESLKRPDISYALKSLDKIKNGFYENSQDIFSQNQQLLKKTPRTSFGIAKEIFSLLFLAFLILVLNRQMVFEHQQIPTGSMRPTFLEMDRLIVSKTSFGVNNPFGFAPLLQDKKLFSRGQIVTFTSEGLPVENQDVDYFGIFPGKKRLVKRLLAKGGDTVYFYGGHLWIVDSEGKLWTSASFLEKPHDYIPFHHFFGHLQKDKQGNITSYHFQKPVFELEKGSWNLWKSGSLDKPIQPWGIQNYGMARLLSRKQAATLIHSPKPLPQQDYFLDIAHHATINPTAISFRDASSPFYVHRTLLPLSKEHIHQLKENLYTSRFRVKDGKAYRFDFERYLAGPGVSLSGTPNGLYEFYNGIAYSIAENGNRTELEKSHNLYKEELLPTLFNSGIDWTNFTEFKESISALMPYRYIYYDRGDLKCMDGLLMKKDDPYLISFIQKEQDVGQSTGGLYPSFMDEGAPSLEKIRKEGLFMGSEEVMLLGDNHAGSGDSRDFGLATYSHIQGSPLFRFWPLSSLKQGTDSPFRGVNTYDLLAAALLIGLCFGFDRWRDWRFLEAKKRMEKV